MAKPRILVVGQRPRGQQEVEREFGRQARLTFFYRGNVRQLQLSARGKDAVFMMTGNIDHMSVEAVRAGGALPRWVNGGTSQLREALQHYLQKGGNSNEQQVA